MFKSKIISLFVAFVLVLGLCITTPMSVSAEKAGSDAEGLTALPAVVPADVAAYYSNDGGNHWFPMKEEKGVIEKSAPAKSKAELFAQRGIKLESSGNIKAQLPSAQSPAIQPMDLPPQYSIFYSDINDSGSMQMAVPPNTTIYSLGSYDNIFSSIDLSSYADNGCTLFDYPNLQVPYWNSPDNQYDFPNLGNYGWNDRASSLVIWPQ
ncbi:MAG: hypothetical protein WBQ62_07685 [Dehalococcoidales bacterium]|jgi:hypothetical protein